MQPERQDVQQLVMALCAVNSSLERARRRMPQASRLSVLQLIAANPRVSPKAIAAELDLHPSSITRQVHVLEDAGHVAVVANQEDRRACPTTLTDAGRGKVNRLTPNGAGRVATFLPDRD